jgi:3-deoxy-D-manno-octulosonic-acid transferase
VGNYALLYTTAGKNVKVVTINGRMSTKSFDCRFGKYKIQQRFYGEFKKEKISL